MIGRIHVRALRIAIVLAACGTLAIVTPAATERPSPEMDPADQPDTAAQPDVLFESAELRIVRILRPDGRRALVLTNLDAGGRRMGGEGPPPAPRTPAPDSRTAVSGGGAETDGAAPDDTEAAPASERGVQVVVRSDDGSSRIVDAGAVETDTRGQGTTIIINIDATPSQPPPAQPPVLLAPFAAIPGFGGIRGSFRYPDHHHFLGYGHDVSSPGFFGGLGLNAGNGFGLSNARACGRGFDCMFGPGRDHP